MVSILRKTIFGNFDKTSNKDSEENVDNADNFTEEEALQKFRNALEPDPDIFGDETLLRFLRMKSYKIPEAVKLFHRHEELNRKNADIFKIPFHKCKGTLESGHLVVLRQRDLHGRRVLLFRSKYWNTAENPLDHCMRIAHYVLEELLLCKETQINGIVVIFDYYDTSITKLAQIIAMSTFGRLSTMISFFQGGYPVKFKGLHLIPTPFIVASAYHAVKFLISKKMRNRVHIHTGDPKSLHEHFGKENLPDFLEGDLSLEDSVDKDLINRLYSKHSY